jgi:hypothetical protein
MFVTPGPQQVEQMVARTFEEFGAIIHSLSELKETVVLHDGQYYARTYRAGGLMAMWFVEHGLVQFYDAEGKMLRTINLLREALPQRMAA